MPQIIRILLPLFACLIIVAGFIPSSTEEGRTLYEHNCVRCHGTDGGRGLFGAKDLRTSALSDTAITIQIMNGKRLMPSFKKKLTSVQVAQLSAYIKTFRR